GMTQKLEPGHTAMRGPSGNLNAPTRAEQSRVHPTVDRGHARAQLIHSAFAQPATRPRPVPDAHAELPAPALPTVAPPPRTSRPATAEQMTRSGFYSILRNPCFSRSVPYKGTNQPGTHEPPMHIDTRQHVQLLLNTRKIASERRRSHDHYLNGSLFCG